LGGAVLAILGASPAFGAKRAAVPQEAAKPDGAESRGSKGRSKDRSFDDGPPSPFLDALEHCQDERSQELDLHAQRLLGALDLGAASRVLVAMVPDPNQTSFGAAFDASLSSIRSAFSSMGYASGGHFLPWRPVDEGARGGKKGGDGPGEDAASSDSKLPSGRCVPGIMVFVRPDPSAASDATSDLRGPVRADSSTGGPQPTTPLREVAFVLLVGETPASGVFANALGQALTFAQRIGGDRIPILGPVFSGSAASLHNGLDRWRAALQRPVGGLGPSAAPPEAGRPRFEIVSGSATSPSVIRELAGPDIDFSATVVPDDVQTCAMYRFVKRRLAIPMSNVALMIEANTTFGAFFRDFACGSENGVKMRPRTIVPFPLHIADLRAAEERRRTAGRTDGSNAGSWAADPLLDLQVDEGRRHMDSLPALRPDLTAVEVQLILAEQLATLCREDIRALGILASDVRDVTVLGEEARRRCPRLLLFALGPDRILHHSRYRDLDGLLVASSYPLHAAASSWMYPFRGRELVSAFPSENAQGVFNASLILMGGTHSLLDYGPPPQLEPAQPKTRPAVWISAVGRDGFWPVRAAVYGKGDHGFVREVDVLPDAAQRAQRLWARRFRPPEGFVFLLVMLVLFTAVNLVGFVMQSHPTAPPSRRCSVWSWLDPYRSVGEPFARSRGVGVACAFGALALMNAGAALLLVMPGYIGESPGMRYEAIGTTYVVGFLLACAAAALCCSPVWSKVDGQVLAHRRFWILFLGGGLVTGFGLTCLLPEIGRALSAYEPDLTLFFKRTTNITSGFSPAPGALLYAMALFAAALTELVRIRLLDFSERFRRSCIPSASPATFAAARLDCVVRTGVRGPLFVLALALLGVLITLPDYHHPLEGRWLGYLFCLAGPYIIAAMIVFQLLRFLRTWMVMRRTFREYLENHNLPAFRKLVRPFFLRTLRPPLDPARAETLIDQCAPIGELGQDDPRREAVGLLLLASYGRAHLHNFLTFVTTAGFLLIVMSTSYPFKLLHSADILTWLVVLTIVAVALFVLVEMNRDEILSRIAGTTPGRVSMDRAFFRTILIHVGLPLLGIAATRFSTVGVVFERFVKPLLQLFGGIGTD
jgi:hypothetical protein